MTAVLDTLRTIAARDLSCQALALLDPEALDFHGQSVEGYAAEIDRRGDDHVNGCDVVGHLCTTN